MHLRHPIFEAFIIFKGVLEMASNNTREGMKKCSFCGRNESQVNFIIPSPDGKAYICDNCIVICSDLIDEKYEIHRAIEKE